MMMFIRQSIIRPTINFVVVFIQVQQITSYPLTDADPDGSGKVKETALEAEQLSTRLTQQEAMAYCEVNRTSGGPGRLVVLLTLEDAKALIDNIFEKSTKAQPTKDIGIQERYFDLGLSRRYWIGLSDAVKENHWTWLKEGSRLAYYDLWALGQPDHYNSTAPDQNEHCAALWNPNFEKSQGNKHTFNDENCVRKYYFICEDHTVPVPVPVVAPAP